MSHRRNKSRKRTRSWSPFSRRNSISLPDVHHEGSPPKRRKDKNDFLQKILQSTESLSERIDSLGSGSNRSEQLQIETMMFCLLWLMRLQAWRSANLWRPKRLLRLLLRCRSKAPFFAVTKEVACESQIWRARFYSTDWEDNRLF